MRWKILIRDLISRNPQFSHHTLDKDSSLSGSAWFAGCLKHQYYFCRPYEQSPPKNKQCSSLSCDLQATMCTLFIMSHGSWKEVEVHRRRDRWGDLWMKAIIVEEEAWETAKQALPLVTWFSLPFCPVQFCSCLDWFARAAITASSLSITRKKKSNL